jgi:hypothetical protein
VPVRETIGFAQQSPNTKTTNQLLTSARCNFVNIRAIEEAIKEIKSLEIGEKFSYQAVADM